MSVDRQPRIQAPDGIAAEPREGTHRGLTALALLVLGTLLAVGLTGMFGGGSSTTTTRDFGAATLAVRAPATLRNGELFEMQIMVEAATDIDDMVIAIDPALWRNITINTQVPGPAEEGFEQGTFRFHYGPLAACNTFTMKVDGQINPPLFRGTAGSVALLDGEAPIGRIPMRIRVLP